MVSQCGLSRLKASSCASDMWQCKTCRVGTSESLCAVVMKSYVLVSFLLLSLGLLDIYGRKSTAELWVHISHPQVRAGTENGQSGVD